MKKKEIPETAAQLMSLMPVYSQERWAKTYNKAHIAKSMQEFLDYYLPLPEIQHWPSTTWVYKFNAWLSRSKRWGNIPAEPLDLSDIFKE